MLKELINKHIIKTHHWRSEGHNQLGDLYVSVGLRTAAVSMVNVFLPFFLWELGYEIPQVIAFYIAFTVFRIPVNYVTSHIIGAIGPKHTIALSTVFNIAYMLLLFSLESANWPLALVALVYTCGNSLFFTAYHTDFSKIKKVKHAGKELGHMSIVQRLGGVVGPLAGGLLASFIDPKASIAAAAIILLASLVPLFMTSEPVRTNQKIVYKGMLRKLLPRYRNTLGLTAHGIGTLIPHILWSFYISVTVFADNAYASLGLITTGAVFLSIFAAKLIGRLTDKGYGRQLIKYGAFADITIAASRLFIGTPLTVTIHNFVREQTVPARTIPIVKGFYAESDEFPGQRIAYITTVENLVMFSRAVFLIGVYLFMQHYQAEDVLRYGSVAASFVGVFAIVQNYKALQR